MQTYAGSRYLTGQTTLLFLLALALSCPLSITPARAGDGDLVWAKAIGGTSVDAGQNIFVDISGNIYSTGGFNGIVDFDPGPDTFNLNSADNGRTFINKLDHNGNFVWAKAMGSATNPWITLKHISADSAGNVYTSGDFKGTADFDPGPGTFNLTSTSADKRDVFISKLDSNGNFIWAKAITGTSSITASGSALDSSGNVYTVGDFEDTADFDPGPDTFNLTSTSAGVSDVFISKLDTYGNFVWAKAIGGPSAQFAAGMSLDSHNNIYTTGLFQGTADFDPGPDTFNINSTESGHVFISKLDINGNFIWAKAIGKSVADHGFGAFDISADSSGNAHLVGIFGGTFDFDPGPDTFNMTSRDAGWDVFIDKLDSKGNFVWAKALSGTEGAVGLFLGLDSSSNVYTSGYFQGTFDFDPGPDAFNLTSAGQTDIFISKLDSNGNFVWGKAIGGTELDSPGDLAVGYSGNVYATGAFIGTLDFDPGPDTFNLTSQGQEDVFLVHLDGYHFPWIMFMPVIINNALP